MACIEREGKMDKAEIKERLEEFCESNNLKAEAVLAAAEGDPIIWECVICGDGFARFTFPYNPDGRDFYNCRLCGSPHLILDGYGDERCDQVVDGEVYIGIGEASEGSFCNYCEEGFSSHPDGTVMAYLASGGKFSARYNGPVLQDLAPWTLAETCNFGNLSEALQKAVKGIVGGSHWVSTGGWRGYEQPGDAEGYEKLLDGWVGWGAGGGGVEFFQHLGQYAQEWGVDLLVVAATTSNVLSTRVDVYVPSDRLEEIREKVGEIDLGMGVAGYVSMR